MFLKKKDFLAQLAADLALLRTNPRGVAPMGVELCADCNQPIQESVTGCHHTDRGCECSDCYYARLGELVDERPIGVGRG